MDNLSNWQQVMEISAAMMGFLLVVMGMIISRRNEGENKVGASQSLMYLCMTSFLMFVISLGISTFISFTASEHEVIHRLGLTWFILAFLIATATVAMIIGRWILTPDGGEIENGGNEEE